MSVSKSYTDYQVKKALESISQSKVVCYHDEAKGYAFKLESGEWKFAAYDFVHDAAQAYPRSPQKQLETIPIPEPMPTGELTRGDIDMLAKALGL